MTSSSNILLITVDQWSGHLLGCAGHDHIETPTLDTLAQAGTRFTSLYSECPVCIPARRSLMTGTSPRRHGDRIFQPDLKMPDLPTLAGSLQQAGYQTVSVGKLHVYPQRDRIGFEDAILSEEGRPQLGGPDDYDMFLADKGYPGRQFMHGMSNNDYNWRPWHLPEDCHVTNWAAEQMCRTIKRRDPTRPAFWNLSFSHPHPPLVPLQSYLDRYQHRALDEAVMGDWSADPEFLPAALQRVQAYWPALKADRLTAMKVAFYALCTHIDHQIRVVIGTLREEGLLEDTAILFVSDHGDMLGDHGLFAKRLFLEASANIPGILVMPRSAGPHYAGRVCDGLFGLADVMPTLLEIAGVTVPDSCDGISMLPLEGRAHLYGECQVDEKATRMMRRGRYKLIWYPAGNIVHLFDLTEDPKEQRNLADDVAMADIRAELTALLIAELYGEDSDLHSSGMLTGFTPELPRTVDNRGLSGQRGLHYPQPPPGDSGQVVGSA